MIFHRDLKPENIVMDAKGHALLTDFGLSTEAVKERATSFCGSPAYLAPEMVKRQGHGKSVDYWSLGVVLYETVTGEKPFMAETREKVYKRIQHARLSIPATMDEDCQSCVKGLLERDVSLRLGRCPEEVRRHPFFAPIDWETLPMKHEVLIRSNGVERPSARSSSGIGPWSADHYETPGNFAHWSFVAENEAENPILSNLQDLKARTQRVSGTTSPQHLGILASRSPARLKTT
mmetsp:Transcript_35491/g.86922  ORF Transcript_35491/g.86922 Transcript_35491/m.86922 type:complete len:234 (+) Transcript_35491:1-702(+)